MPVQLFRYYTSSTDFQKWIWFLRRKKQEELEVPSKQDWYLARIACEISNVMKGFSKNKRPNKVEKFILKFKSPKKRKITNTPEQVDVKVQNSKNFWKSIAGVNSGSKQKRPRKGVLPDHVKQMPIGEK